MSNNPTIITEETCTSKSSSDKDYRSPSWCFRCLDSVKWLMQGQYYQ